MPLDEGYYIAYKNPRVRLPQWLQPPGGAGESFYAGDRLAGAQQ